MEIVKKKIHMCCPAAEASLQFALEEDVNFPDFKKDAESICLESGEVEILETKPENGTVTVNGQLVYKGLYHTTEPGCPLCTFGGKIPFREKIHLEGTDAGSRIIAEGRVEDLSIRLINSRKWNVQALLNVTVTAEEEYEEDIPVGVQETAEKKASLQYHTCPVVITRNTVCKNDILRIKEEMTVPSGYPNIASILWEKVSLQDMEFRAMNDRIDVTGDAALFVLYEGEGEEHPVRTYETVLPIKGTIECRGLKEENVADVKYCIGQKEITVRPDPDGEERCLGLDLVLQLYIRAYAEDKQELVDDLYSTVEDTKIIGHESRMYALTGRFEGKLKLADNVKVDGTNLFLLLHSECLVLPEEPVVQDRKVFFRGSVKAKLLYITGDDEKPYASVEKLIPYEYGLETPNVLKGEVIATGMHAERLTVNMKDGEEAEIRLLLDFTAVAFHKIGGVLPDRVEESPVTAKDRKKMPAIVVYTVKEQDTLWSVGKKYKVPVAALMATNDLQSEEVKKGSRLLVMRE